jgi:dihydrofolate reductase
MMYRFALIRISYTNKLSNGEVTVKGDEPLFGMPVYVVTYRLRETVTMRGRTTYTFVTGGIEAALGQARAAACGRDVAVGCGANLAQQYLKAGLLEEIQVHLVPVLLGDGVTPNPSPQSPGR